jgi:hypothetical protein
MTARKHPSFIGRKKDMPIGKQGPTPPKKSGDKTGKPKDNKKK